MDQFSHPNPFVLSLPRDAGGFDKPEWQLYLLKVNFRLNGGLLHYGAALAAFAEEVDGKKVSEILTLTNESNSELTTTLQDTITRLPPDDRVQAP